MGNQSTFVLCSQFTIVNYYVLAKVLLHYKKHFFFQSDDASHKRNVGLLNKENTSRAYHLQKNVTTKPDIDNQEFLDCEQKLSLSQKKCINHNNSFKVYNTRQMRNVTNKQGINPEKYLEASVNQPDMNIQQDEIDTLSIPATSQSRRKWDKRDYCFFCEVDVLKFSRHLLRHHTSEIEVQQILALKVGDKRRKIMFNKLRNEGNFLKSTTEENVIPIRKATSDEPPNLSTYLPCKFCKGFYKKTSLFRHIKVCPQNTDGRSKRTNAQADGQSLLATCSQNDSLRAEIFPTLRADQISLAAKTDKLICAVARRYLKSHRDKQFRVVASRKMRQLGALLIELRAELKVKSLFDVMTPKNFDALVHCTKKISKYNAETQTYGAPSLAANMGTLIKECIDAAYSLSLKSGISRDKLEELKILKDLIITEWKYEVGTIANNNLQQNKWNKPSLIPLAQDLALIKAYLTTEAKKHVCTLEKEGNNQKAFKTLQEIVYVQLLLLNRRRVGELQRMTLLAYTSNITNETSSEFDSCVSESEKILMNSFKRVVIRGKRGRGVPVLFTEEMTNNTNLLIRLRDNFVDKYNLFLFANINSTTSINGASAVYKHVRLAGVQNAAAITSTKLRKHLATMSQIINLSPQDLEQLASFMGHTSATHMNFYRLPDDIYQTAKVSKLLLLSEKGQAAKFKGKQLDEIDINLEIEDEADSDNNDDEFVNIDHHSREADENKTSFVTTSSNPLVKIVS